MGGQRYTLRNQNRCLEVDSAGGRIMTFSLAGKNCLADKAMFPGATFWTSPQSDWGWPPPAVIDSDEYAVLANTGESIQLASGHCPKLKVQVRKAITPIEQGFRIVAEIQNIAASEQKYAPWQVTRVLGGATYFRSGTGLTSNTGLLMQSEGDAFCYRHDPSLLSEGQKCFANESSGWIANINDGLVFIKRFSAIPAAEVAPEEGELEVYAFESEQNPYVEVEVQGSYQTIPAGGYSQWSVDWLLFQAPDSLIQMMNRKNSGVNDVCRAIEELMQH